MQIQMPFARVFADFDLELLVKLSLMQRRPCSLHFELKQAEQEQMLASLMNPIENFLERRIFEQSQQKCHQKSRLRVGTGQLRVLSQNSCRDVLWILWLLRPVQGPNQLRWPFLQFVFYEFRL